MNQVFSSGNSTYSTRPVQTKPFSFVDLWNNIPRNIFPSGYLDYLTKRICRVLLSKDFLVKASLLGIITSTNIDDTFSTEAFTKEFPYAAENQECQITIELIKAI